MCLVFPTFNVTWLWEKVSKILLALFHHSVVLRPMPIKSILTFFKLLKPAFRLECIQELVPMGCWEQQGFPSPALDMSSVHCWRWAVPPKRLLGSLKDWKDKWTVLRALWKRRPERRWSSWPLGICKEEWLELGHSLQPGQRSGQECGQCWWLQVGLGG